MLPGQYIIWNNLYYRIILIQQSRITIDQYCAQLMKKAKTEYQ